MASLIQESFSVKSDLNGDKRRFTICRMMRSEGMAALQQKLATVYNAGELTLKYEDDEKDLVTLKTNEDLAEALKFLHGEGPLRITVRDTTSPAAAQEKANFQPNFQVNIPEVMELICNGLYQFKLMKQQFKQASHETKDGRHQQPYPNQEPAGLGVGLGKQGNPVKQMARFVQHVTLPDGEKVPASQSCTKTWRVRNDSPHTWPVGSTLILVSGKNSDNIATAESFPVTAALAPGEETDLSVEVLAPAQPGFYQAFWRLQGPKGRKFGQRLGCSMLVTDDQGAVMSSSSDSDGDDAAGKAAKKEKKLLKQAQDEEMLANFLRNLDSDAEFAAAKVQLRAMRIAQLRHAQLELAAARLAHKKGKKAHKKAQKLVALRTAQAGPSTAPTSAGTPLTDPEESEFEMVDEAFGDAATA